MSRNSLAKRERQQKFLEMIKDDPFMTDEDIAQNLKVSIPTVRLDRLELGVPELRERMKAVASENHKKVKTLSVEEIVGEIIDIKLGVSGISVLETTTEMAFEESGIVRGNYIYSLAESLAIAVIDADAALVGVANIKYRIPVKASNKLVAKAEVKRTKDRRNLVWVFIYENKIEVFRGKFILVAMDNKGKIIK